MSTDDEFLYGDPETENDDMLYQNSQKHDDVLAVMKMDIDKYDKKRKDKKYFSAFRLIVACLIILISIYICDSLLMACIHNDVSSLTKDIVEIIKALLFSLSGYLFAKKEGD